MDREIRGRLREAVKIGLVRVGAVLPERFHYNANAALNYLWVGAWMRKHGYRARHRVRDRYTLFDIIARTVAAQEILYLEFGVSRGDSLRYWSKLLVNPRCQLHGFDSFEGLPADWVMGRPAGHFTTHGRPPVIEDSRLTLHQGWFDDTLPTFVMPPHERLVVVSDADLYRSTVTVLDYLRDKIVSGTFLYFDEFNHRADELRAFEEFVSATGIHFELFAATPEFAHVAFVAV